MNEPNSKAISIHEAPSRLTQAIGWFRERVGARPEASIKEIIEEALQEESVNNDSTISAEEKSLLKNMIHFGELTAHDVMIPRSDIMGIKRGETLEELKRHVVEIGHTRIPVYDDSLDTIEGFIHVKDLFSYLSAEKFEIGQVMREILFIPPSMRIVDLLVKMRVSGCHIAIVVDEFGGTDGLVTMEDLFEELVGEIQDEHDQHETENGFNWLGDHIIEVDARTTIEKLESLLGEHLEEPGAATHSSIDTLGGFIIQHLGRVPVRGEVVMLKSTLKAEVTAADPRRVRSVRLTRVVQSGAGI